MSDHVAASARVAARFREPWLRGYAASKLRSDPVFERAHELLADAPAPILDVGCGVGLLAFYLRERGCRQRITGLDIDRRKIERANAAARLAEDENLQFIEADVGDLPGFEGNIAVFDLLHYLPCESQCALLTELATRIPPGALLLLREAPADGSLRHWCTRAGERFAQAIAWNIGAPLHFPSAELINDAFGEREFTRATHPMWGRTPFNNQLFVFQRRV